jgi:hypothetical protein
MDNAIIINFELTGKYKYKCPRCFHIQEEIVSISPYSIPAEDPYDSMCQSCKEYLNVDISVTE